MFNFGIKNSPAFGLDISSTSLKFLQLRQDRSQASVHSYGQAALPKGAVVGDAIIDKKVFSYALKQALDKPHFGRVNTEYAVASLPEAKSFVRVIQLPKMSDSEANNAVPFEAESFIPMPLDQVYLDWQKISVEGDLSRLGQAEADKMNVLIIASPKDYVDQLLETLDGAGVKTVALEVESQSCHRALIAPGSLETCVIVNIGSMHTNIIMVERGSLQFTSTVPIAGMAFTDAVAKSLGVSAAKAQEIKEKVGIGNTVQYPNIKISTVPVLKTLAAEIKNILKFHNEHSPVPVDRMLVTGGGARMKNLQELIAEEFAEFPTLKLEVADPWVNLPQIKNNPLSGEEALSYTTAIGLAMRGAFGN